MIVFDFIWPDIGEKVVGQILVKSGVFFKKLKIWFDWFYGTRTPAGYLMPNFIYTQIKLKIYK